MSAKRKKDAASPAQDSCQPVPTRATPDADGEKDAAAPAQDSCQPVPTTPEQDPAEAWTDPWAAAKCAGLRVERVIEKCPGRAERDERGVWKVTPAVLEACGTSPTASRQVVAMARSLSTLPPEAEGAVVYALSGPGRVAVRSCAKAPRSSRVLAQVREPSRLRCGDEVVVRYTESGRAEVIHGR